jgi:hypothetical protein
MKRIIFLIVIFLTSLCFGAIEKGATVDKSDGGITFYYKVTGTDLAAEASTLIWPKTFYGHLEDVLVIATTSDNDVQVVLSIDPPESPTATQSTTATAIWTHTYTSDGIYVIPVLDSSSNVYGGPRVSGKIYMQIKNAVSATTTSIQVYVFGKLD